MDTLYEIAKAVGAASGLLAISLLLWDRYVKHVPVAVVVARPLMAGSRQIAPFLHLKNPSDRPILVSWNNGDYRKMRVAKGQSLEGVLQTMFDGETTISLDGGAEAVLPIFKPRDYDDISSESQIELCLRWKFAQPRIWKVDRSIVASIRKIDLDQLIDGYYEHDEG
ncbi:hypothetical protein A5906_07250 [Bradyrhizobium sacchari]|uniref:Uncharacterized protein n=1 Tax=Bradyrhizobium sacchari TaxID=1399419 RepID=A0A560KKX3_9BRAD|nr:hypothetical protein [Bradyrhizobium sacchari]OPY95757.1 hypothetical protein A5906_07250 [Bradyrhizobium sacchari]TWB66621.1 hypothetical protein FBZ94_101297 [Bradyrhizobium sacchari]TWB83857.1 hypothetical protein FBZ95_101296 [Bradyrhizobium sacchari]